MSEENQGQEGQGQQTQSSEGQAQSEGGQPSGQDLIAPYLESVDEGVRDTVGEVLNRFRSDQDAQVNRALEQRAQELQALQQESEIPMTIYQNLMTDPVGTLEWLTERLQEEMEVDARSQLLERWQQGQQQQDHSHHPVELARRLVRAGVEDARHVQEDGQHHAVGHPAVHVAHELAEADVGLQPEDVLVRALHGGDVIEHQQDAGDGEAQEEEEGETAQAEGVGDLDVRAVDAGGVEVEEDVGGHREHLVARGVGVAGAEDRAPDAIGEGRVVEPVAHRPAFRSFRRRHPLSSFPCRRRRAGPVPWWSGSSCADSPLWGNSAPCFVCRHASEAMVTV
jgi:hypothetical protein